MTTTFTCHPQNQQRLVARRGKKSALTVDIHCHVEVPSAVKLMASLGPDKLLVMGSGNSLTAQVQAQQAQAINARLTEIPARLEAMDAAGIDVQALSPSPSHYYYDADPGLALQAHRLVNERIAEIGAAHPDRFVGLGTVPLQRPEFATEELERMVKSLGLRGVEIGTNVAGEDLSSARFRPFFAKAEELGILIFLHPMGFTEPRRLSEHYFANVIGNPLDTTIALSHLIFGGVLADYPGLKLCAAHGGGYLAAYAGRMDHAHCARPDCRAVITEPPSTYLRRLYFDTLVFSHQQLEYLVQEYGADHILLGSDFPYDMGDADPVGFVESAGIGDDAKNRILGQNAAELLGIAVPKRA